jgi:hypothetical protein
MVIGGFKKGNNEARDLHHSKSKTYDTNNKKGTDAHFL